MAACEERIPIYPVRYTVIDKYSLNDFDYNHDDLEKSYPKLKHSAYTLRLLREGFVYIYDANKGSNSALQLWKVNTDGTFTELTSLNKIPDNTKAKYKEGHTHSFISACAESPEAYVCFTDTLWTEAIYKKVAANEGGFCEKFMTKVNVKEWAGTRTEDGIHKGKNTFPAAEMQQYVEEYKNDMKHLAWSERTTTTPYAKAEAHKNIMSSIASRGQVVVALYDNVGLVQDQGMLIHKRRKAIGEYTQSNARKNLVSNLIEKLYLKDYASENSITDEKQLDKSIQDEVDFKLTQVNLEKAAIAEYEKQGMTNDPSYEFHKKQYAKLKKDSDADYRSEVIANHSELKTRHIDEKRRIRDRNEFNKELKRLSDLVLETKNDRWALLNSYQKTNKPTDFGSAFLNYDDDNPISKVAHCQAFARGIEGMMADPSCEEIVNKEHDLFETWFQSKGENPILDNLARDLDLTAEEKDNPLLRALKDKKDSVSDVTGGVDKIIGQFRATEDEIIALKEAITESTNQVEEALKQAERLKSLNVAEAAKLNTLISQSMTKAENAIKAAEKIKAIKAQEATSIRDAITKSRAQAKREIAAITQANALTKQRISSISESIRDAMTRAKNASNTALEATQAATALETNLHIRYATAEITHNIVTYSLTRWKNWNGAVLNNIDEMFNRLLNMNSLENATRLRKILTDQSGLSGRYAQNVVATTINPTEYWNHFADAANLTTEQRALLHSTGGLKGDHRVLQVTNVVNTDILDTQQDIQAHNNRSDVADLAAQRANKEVDDYSAARERLQAAIDDSSITRIQADALADERALQDALSAAQAAANDTTTPLAASNTREKIEKLEEALKRTQAAIDDTAIPNDVVNAREKVNKAREALNKGQNPFSTLGEVAFTGLDVILNVMNLKAAIDLYHQRNPLDDDDKNVQRANLLSAVIGVASSINGSLSTAKVVLAHARFEKYVAQRAFLHAVVSKTATKVFGFLTAIADGAVQGFKSYQQFNIGNMEAAQYYAYSGLLLLGGGVLIVVAGMVSAPVIAIGLIIAGIGLIIGGVISMLKGDDALWGLMDEWLQRCVYAKIKPDDAYDNETIEYERYLEARYQPKIEADWNRRGADTVTITISPSMGVIQHSMDLVASNFPPKFNPSNHYSMSSKSIINQTNYEKDESGRISYLLYSKKLADDVEVIAGYFSYMPILTDKYKHWITSNYRVFKGFAWGATVKPIKRDEMERYYQRR